MLNIIFASSPDQKKQILSQSSQATWVVAHIEAKRYIQKKSFESRVTLAGDQTLRASELWHKIFMINLPDWKIVSDSFVFIFLEQWFDTENIAVEYKNIETFYNFFDQMLPLLSSKNDSLFEEWVSLEPSRRERLLLWWNLAQKFWAVLLEKKWITRSWCPSILLQTESLQLPEIEDYVFDLGVHIQQLEIDLILQISQIKKVTLLVPQKTEEAGYDRLLSVYDRAINRAIDIVSNDVPINSCKKKLRSSSSSLSEVKMAVSQVREWIDSGIDCSQIAIASPLIEEYWPLLQAHLKVEGVSTYKNSVARMISLPDVQLWLSRIHVECGSFESNYLEEVLYRSDSQPAHLLPYTEYQKKFSHIYNSEKVKTYFKPHSLGSTSNQVTVVEFLEKIYSLWPNTETHIVERVSDEMFSDVDPEWMWTWALWIKYLELILGRMEVTVERGIESGVLINNIGALDWSDFSHLVVLGCHQDDLRETIKTPALPVDIWDLQRDLGFYLNQTESCKKEFDLFLLCSKRLVDIVLSRSEMNLNGDPQMTSSFWLKDSLKFPEDTSSQSSSTRWDELMQQPLAQICNELKISDVEEKIFHQRMIKDFDLQWMNHKSVEKKMSLSATSLTKLSQCSFKFYAEKVLKLSESQIYDLDIDPMYQGSLMHRLLELLLIEYPSLVISYEELSSLYDKVIEEFEDAGELEEFWLLEKPRHLKLISSFIEAEKKWRHEFPSTKTVAFEKPIDGFIEVLNGQLQFQKNPGTDSYAFRGKIDRIDEDSKGFLGLIDYKSAKNATILTPKNWAQNDQFQLALYSLAIEHGIVEGFSGKKVGSAYYLFLKDQQRGQGFTLDQCKESFLKVKPITQDEKDLIWSEIQEKVKLALCRIQSGDFRPLPKNIKICESCHWRSLCRAPHL